MNKKILIIDDEEQDRKAMSMVFAREGYNQILCADEAEKGIEMVKSYSPDIIVIDVVLLNADGFDVCRKVKAIENLKAKIIMITGHLDAVNVRKARASGADELIEKTFDFENIIQTIKVLSGN